MPYPNRLSQLNNFTFVLKYYTIIGGIEEEVGMKKNLILLALVCASICAFANFASAASDEPVEMTAPKTDTVKTLTDADLSASPKNVNEAKPADKTKKVIKKRHIIHKKIVVDYDKVSKLIEYNYFDQADSILEGAIDRNPKDVKAQALWAVSLAKQTKLDPAQSELDNLLKKYPDNSNLHYAQGVVYYQRTTSSNMLYRNNSQKLTQDAMKEFKKAIELDKKNARAYNAAGVISLKLGNTKEATEYFNKSLEADKTYSMAIDNLGTMDFAQGKLKDAEAKFKQSLTYNTQNTTAMYHLAQIALKNDDPACALIYLNNALYINQNSPAIYNLMGKAYMAQGNEAAAINAFRQSISVKPEFTRSYIDLAEIYEKRNDGEFAIEQLKTAISIDPTYNDAKLKLADISLANAKYAQAISVYSELVGIDGYNDFALKGLANAYYGKAQTSSIKSLLGSNKDLFNAIDYINKAVSANPNDLELHLAKLKLTKLTNQPDLTKIELNKIINSKNSDLTSLVVKGEAYTTLNDYQNAQKSFNEAINLSKNTDDDLYLSEIFIYHKQYDCADKILQKILQKEPQNQQALSNVDYIKKSKKYAETYFNTAQSCLKSKNANLTTEYLSRSLAINPNNASARLLLAQIYEKQKDYQGAMMNYKAYLSLNPNCVDSKKIQDKINKFQNRL